MPKGDNPNSRKNLKRYTSEEARKYGAIGGKASAKTRGAYNSVKEVLLDLGTQIHTNGKGQKAQGYEIIGRKLFSMAQQGNSRAMELCLKMFGELTNSVDVTTNGKDVAVEPIKVEIIDKREQVETEEE